MSLYDDFDAIKQKSDQVAGWSSGIKLFQSQLQLKKASQTQPRREHARKTTTLAPVIDLKSKRDDDDGHGLFFNKDGRADYGFGHYQQTSKDPDWTFDGAEYDPLWPNDYEKVVKDVRIQGHNKARVSKLMKAKLQCSDCTFYCVLILNYTSALSLSSRPFDPQVPAVEAEQARRMKTPSGFAGRRDSDEEDEDEESVGGGGGGGMPRSSGVAIAPPPSLQQEGACVPPPPELAQSPKVYGASVAAKIMAKYGFKEGQGLGKKEQGISMALQVEKTSKRGGRIIHERDILIPSSLSPAPPPSLFQPGPSNTPPPPPAALNKPAAGPEPSITEIMKSPSKVVLLRNMVGPGEVDSELEPEVKDECNTKYGDVIRVIIHELPEAPSDEAVRIFVEFKRIESAIKGM
ncbi:splicing factor 45-like [Nilaparvata lugens]|uniref:splicing factor 45-like n=1 Tax=Nilaparvata lugens TaxID=108931 RepID=UPI00193DA4B7|nr:splicing factor 45-like [Nilaparvata lugens]